MNDRGGILMIFRNCISYFRTFMSNLAGYRLINFFGEYKSSLTGIEMALEMANLRNKRFSF
jgi:hypothetical protein